jgi:hypothetical protein
VMRAQLRRLAAARDRSNVMVQVLPFTAGEHPAMASGPFDLLEFGQTADRGAGTLETMTGSLSLESDTDLRHYADAFDFLQAAALGPRETRDMLITLAEQI